MNLGMIKKYSLFFLGSISVGIGVIGIFVPVLPTTPLLLLAAFCYLRSSEKMYNWLINHKILGAYIYSYLIYKAIPVKTKIGAIIFLWSTLCISMLLISSLHMKIFLSLIGIGVTIHLMMLKTLSFEEMKVFNDSYHNKTGVSVEKI